MAGRAIAVVITAHKVGAIVILEFLLKGQRIELSPESELPINLFLADVEVLHIEEAWDFVRVTDREILIPCGPVLHTDLGDSMVKLLDQLFFSAGLVKLAEVESDQVCPIHCLTLAPHTPRFEARYYSRSS